MMTKKVNQIDVQETYLTVSDVKQTLKISQSAAYELTHRKDFPVCRIGGSIRIPKSLFLLWLKEMTYVPANLSEYTSA